MSNFNKIKKVLATILGLNWFVALAKIIFGMRIGSASMVADGYHSFSDGASNIVGLVGINIANRPVDADHPYGHKKYETFTAVIIAIMLFLVAFNLIHDNIARLKNPVPPRVDIYGFAVMIVTMAINIAVMLYEYRMGRRLHSDILVSDSKHTRSDVLTSLSVIVALAAARMGFPIADPICSLLISLFIAYMAVDILLSSSKVLCDTAAVDKKKIMVIVNAIEGVTGCHNIRTRGREDDIHVDLHVLVRPTMHVDRADKLGDQIEQEIKQNISGVTDVIVHIEPGPR